MERIVVAISPPSIFTLGSLRSPASPVKSYGCRPRGFCDVSPVMLRLCSGYALGIERSCVVGGRNPP